MWAHYRHMPDRFGGLSVWMPWIIIIVAIMVVVVVLFKWWPGKKLERTLNDYDSVLDEILSLSNRYLSGEITKEEFETVVKPLMERAKHLEKLLADMGIGPEVFRTMRYAVFGVTVGGTIAAVVKSYLNRPPKGPTMSDRSETAKSDGEPASPAQVSRTKKWVAKVLKTDEDWVVACWGLILIAFIVCGAGYLLTAPVSVPFPTEPVWLIGFIALVHRLAGKPPQATSQLI